MNIPDKNEIIATLENIFPKVIIYFVEYQERELELPKLSLALDVGRHIGQKDLQEAQLMLNEKERKYDINLADLQSVSESERTILINTIKRWN